MVKLSLIPKKLKGISYKSKIIPIYKRKEENASG